MLAGVSVAPAQKGGSSTKMADLVDGGRQETGMGQLNKKETDSFESASMRGGSRIRTGDPMLAKHVLYQLSYTPSIQGALPPHTPLRLPG